MSHTQVPRGFSLSHTSVCFGSPHPYLSVKVCVGVSHSSKAQRHFSDQVFHNYLTKKEPI